jgi:hypothetical protein
VINSLNLVYSTPETGDGDSCPILSENKLKFSRKHHEVFLKFVQTTEGFVQQIKQISRVCCTIVISPLTGFIVSDILAFCLSWFFVYAISTLHRKRYFSFLQAITASKALHGV